MTDAPIKAFLYLKDYAELGLDRFFLCCDEGLTEVTASELVNETALLICHDYWLVAPTLVRHCYNLPQFVVDVDEFHVMISGSKQERKLRDKKDISRRSTELSLDNEITTRYFSIFNKTAEFEESTYEEFGFALLDYWKVLVDLAKEKNEFDRFLEIEQPVSRYLIKSAAKGISISVERLREHKITLNHDYYTALKNFSATYNLPLEVPSDLDVIEYLEPKGFDFSGVDVDYILRFVPMEDNFASDLMRLRKLAHSKDVLGSLPLSQNQIYPIVDVFGSITSRIYFKFPVIQNIAKKHRDIIVPSPGKQLCYVDYDQYEVGIMAALSGDPLLMEYYSSGDIYSTVASFLFSDISKRKYGKRLFLAYAYGMNRKSLMSAAEGYDAQRAIAKQFFDGFKVFEQWKVGVWQTFLNEKRIGTSLGNYLLRDGEGPLTGAEQRSAVSQVVQGTASLIFKKALLALSQLPHVELKVPMHDAALLQVPLSYDVSTLPRIFETVMSDHFDGKITGKASIESFFPG